MADLQPPELRQDEHPLVLGIVAVLVDERAATHNLVVVIESGRANPGPVPVAVQASRSCPRRSRTRRRKWRKLSMPKAHCKMACRPWLNPSVLPLLDRHRKSFAI